MLLASSKLNLKNELDNKMFNHITYVANSILIMLRDEGANRDVLEKSGKFLLRLFLIFQAYNGKKRSVTLNEVLSIVSEFKSVFVGG